MIERSPGRVLTAAMTLALLISLAGRTTLRAQQPPAGAPPAAAPQGAPQPGGGGGRGGAPKNIQVLKDVPRISWGPRCSTSRRRSGVQCNYCHVQGQNDLDDKETKKIARDMMKMVADVNSKFFDGKDRLSCASCHNGHAKPSKTPPLSIEMTPAQAQAAAAARGRGPGGPGGPGGGGAPGGAGRGGAPAAPPEPTETVDDVVSKYVQALGGTSALQAAKTRVMTGTVTSRDLVTTPATVQEKATGEYRIDIATTPIPTVRAFNGKTAWTIAAGPRWRRPRRSRRTWWPRRRGTPGGPGGPGGVAGGARPVVPVAVHLVDRWVRPVPAQRAHAEPVAPLLPALGPVGPAVVRVDPAVSRRPMRPATWRDSSCNRGCALRTSHSRRDSRTSTKAWP